MLRADEVARVLAEVLATPEVERTHGSAASEPQQQEGSWKARLWTVPAETRLNVNEVAEALGRTKSWVYRHTGVNAGSRRLPHRKLEGELVFVASEVREWIERHEDARFPIQSHRGVVL